MKAEGGIRAAHARYSPGGSTESPEAAPLFRILLQRFPLRAGWVNVRSLWHATRSEAVQA